MKSPAQSLTEELDCLPSLQAYWSSLVLFLQRMLARSPQSSLLSLPLSFHKEFHGSLLYSSQGSGNILHALHNRICKGSKEGSGEVASRRCPHWGWNRGSVVKMLIAPAEVPGSIPSSQVRWLTMPLKIGSWASKSLLWLPQACVLKCPRRRAQQHNQNSFSYEYTGFEENRNQWAPVDGVSYSVRLQYLKISRS